MKNSLLTLLCALLLQTAFAQDVIIKIDGTEIKARVLEITLSEVVYQSPDSVESRSQSISKSEVFMVRFANGTREVFQENLPAVADSGAQPNDPAQMYYQGQQDALRYYKGNGAMWGSAASLTMGPLGIVGPIIIGSTKPKAHKNPVPAQHLLLDQNYVNGYEKQAHKRKIGKAALGTGIGTVALVALLLITVSAGQ